MGGDYERPIQLGLGHLPSMRRALRIGVGLVGRNHGDEISADHRFHAVGLEGGIFASMMADLVEHCSIQELVGVHGPLLLLGRDDSRKAA